VEASPDMLWLSCISYSAQVCPLYGKVDLDKKSWILPPSLIVLDYKTGYHSPFLQSIVAFHHTQCPNVAKL
jgi:hypothetical protein